MPFTASHPAAVLPFLHWLPPGALVVGSMAPDFPYFVPVGVTGAITHAALGVVTVDVLLAAAAWVLWRFLVWPAVLGLTPPLRARVGPAAPVRPLLLAPAFALGAATHVGWDSFTHRRMWGPAHIGALRAFYGPLPGYAWAQYLSTVVGAAILVWWCARWWRRAEPERAAQRTSPGWPAAAGRWAGAAWAVVVGAGLCGVGWGIVDWAVAGDGTWGGLMWSTSTGGGAAAGGAVLAVSVAWAVGVRAGRRPRSA